MFTLSLVLFVSRVGLSVGSVARTDTGDFSNYQPIQRKLPECGPNEVLNLCVGCPPEDTCYDRHQIGCGFSLFNCGPGCVCKEGFIRKTLGRECIPKEDCGGPCGISEQYTECKQISNETCSSTVNPVKFDSKEACTPGCTCWPGHYRADENSPCEYRCFCPELEDTPDCLSRRLLHFA